MKKSIALTIAAAAAVMMISGCGKEEKAPEAVTTTSAETAAATTTTAAVTSAAPKKETTTASSAKKKKKKKEKVCDPKAVGMWNLLVSELKGGESLDYKNTLNAQGYFVFLILDEGGKGSFDHMGDISDAEWGDGKVRFEGVQYTFEVSDDSLTLKRSDEIMIFERTDPSLYDRSYDEKPALLYTMTISGVFENDVETDLSANGMEGAEIEFYDNGTGAIISPAGGNTAFTYTDTSLTTEDGTVCDVSSDGEHLFVTQKSGDSEYMMVFSDKRTAGE